VHATTHETGTLNGVTEVSDIPAEHLTGTIRVAR
jgi:hypothetical protein